MINIFDCNVFCVSDNSDYTDFNVYPAYTSSCFKSCSFFSANTFNIYISYFNINSTSPTETAD